MNRLKRFTTTFLCGSLITSVVLGSTGCSFMDKSPEQILDISTSFCDALCDGDSKAASKLVNEKDTKDYFEDIFDFDAGDNNPLMDAIKESISYELDEDSVEGSKKDGEGSADVVFTVVDYEKVASEGEYYNASELASAISDSKDTKEIELTLELEYTDDKDNPWLIENYEDIMDEVYAHIDFEPDYKVDIASLVNYTDVIVTPYTGTNVMSLDFEIGFSEDVEDCYDSGYVNLIFNGNVIASRPIMIYTDWTYCDFYSFDYEGQTEDGFFPEGTYTFEAYLDDGTFICSDSAEVFYVAPTPTPTPEPDDPYAGATMHDGAVMYDEDGAFFYEGANDFDITYSDWVIMAENEDGSIDEIDSRSVDEIDYVCYVVDTPESHDFTCRVFYYEDPNTTLSEISTASVLVDCAEEYIEYDDGTCGYVIGLDTVQPGVYAIMVYSEEAVENGYDSDIILDMIEFS